MTLREKYEAVLADLLAEKATYGEKWAYYYDHHIAQLQAAIAERFGGGVNEENKTEEAVLAREVVHPTDGA